MTREETRGLLPACLRYLQRNATAIHVIDQTSTNMAVMARIWKEPWDSSTSRGAPDGNLEGIIDWSSDAIAPIKAHKKNPTLLPHESVFVNVCSFTFRFESLPQLERAIAYYEQKILPSSIIPTKDFLNYGGDSGEAQRWYERLPLYLREEPKRQKVVKALNAARVYFDGTK